MEEINNFQQEPNESLFRALEGFKELLTKCPQHYLIDMQEVGCELCKGLHYNKDFPLKEEGKALEESYYTQQTMEESLTKFMAELAKRHEENSNIIKEIQASTDAAIRNQGASIKTLEI
ncbi:hypothetical protein Tco_0522525 [Tanacetum coccineum]